MSRSVLISVVALVLAISAPAMAVQAQPDASPAGEKPAQSAQPAEPAADAPDSAATDAGETGETAQADAAAALEGKLLLPSDAVWTWWSEDAEGNPVSPPSEVDGDTIEWKLDDADAEQGGGAAGISLLVLNQETGNVARIPAGEAAGEDTRLANADFDLIHRVVIQVAGKSGDPVRSALVQLTDSQDKVHSRAINASDRGEAVFNNIPEGGATVRAASGEENVSREITLDLDRDDPVATAEVVIPGDVPTVAAARDGEAAPVEEDEPVRGPSIIQAIIALILLAAVAYLVWLALKARKVTLRSALEKAGLQVEDTTTGGGVAGPAPTPTAAPPLDPSMVGPEPGAPSTGPVSTAPSGPKLVGIGGTYSGAIFPISGDPALIGRDPTADVPLPDDGTASRRHAMITRSGGEVTVRDQGSSNGTLVNGQKVQEQKLSPGDEIQIGSTRFRYEA